MCRLGQETSRARLPSDWRHWGLRRRGCRNRDQVRVGSAFKVSDTRDVRLVDGPKGGEPLLDVKGLCRLHNDWATHLVVRIRRALLRTQWKSGHGYHACMQVHVPKYWRNTIQPGGMKTATACFACRSGLPAAVCTDPQS